MHKEEEEQRSVHKVYAKFICNLYIKGGKSGISYAKFM